MNIVKAGLIALVLCGVSVPSWAGDIKGYEAYAYATAGSQKNGAVFMQLENQSDVDTKVLSAEAGVAEKVELHTHMMDGDKMMMRQVDGYDLPAGQHIVLHPAGHHIMLMGLREKLTAGDQFEMTLSFDHHDPIIVDVQVVSPGTTPPETVQDEHTHHSHH